MKVKWQSDAPNMELVIPKGQYLPYELPVATKEVLGGVKVDGDTINITSDGVISTQKVDLSGVATKVELEEVENKIPDTSGLATKSELATVESKIPDTSGLATKIELTAVENKIPDVSGFATKDEIPNVSGLATKVELNEVAATIPNSDDLATKAELNAVQSSIPDTTGLATKVELSNVEAKIPDTSNFATKAELPTEYVKSVNSTNNALTFTTNSNNTVEYKPIFYVNATMAGLGYWNTSEVKTYYIEGLNPITADATYVEIKNALVDGQIVQLKMTDASHNQFWIMASDYSREENTNKIWFSGHGYYLDSHPWTFYATVNESNEWSFKGYDIYVLAVADSKEWVKQQAFATQASLSNVEAKIPDISGLATKVELSNVAADIPETYLEVANLGDGSLTIINNKGESVTFTPSTGGAVDSVNGQTGTVVLDIPTKVSELENDSGYLTSHQDISNLATKVELSTVEAKIPDTSNFATKVELSAVEGSIPSEYLKNASVADNKLTITKSSGDTIEFTGGGSGGGQAQLNYNILSTATFTEQNKEVMKSAIKFGTGFSIDGCKVIRIIGFGSRRIFIILKANGATDNHIIGYQVDTDADKNVISSVFSTFIDYVLVGSNSAISGDIITSDNWESYIHLSTSEWIKANGNDDSNLYNAKQLWVIAMNGNSYYEGIFRFDYSYATTVLGDCTNIDFRLDDTFPFSYNGNSLKTSSGVIIAVYYKT